MARRQSSSHSRAVDFAVRLTIIAEGKLRERGLREVADDYLARIRRRIRCDEVEVRNAGALLKALPAGARIVALDVRGRSLTSRDFAGLLAEWAERGDPHVAFLVGGASGLSSAVMGRKVPVPVLRKEQRS